jgi:hypothetical protein
VAFGTSDERFTGELAIGVAAGRATVTLEGGRSIHDFSDVPVISGVLNSILAQEAGEDYGDYVMVDRVGVGVRYPLSGVTAISLNAAYEDPSSLGVEASPAHDSYRSNPALGSDPSFVGRVSLVEPGELGAYHRLAPHSSVPLRLKAAPGANDYLRATVDGTVAMPAWARTLGFTAYGGCGVRRNSRLPELRSGWTRHASRGAISGLWRKSHRAGQVGWDFPVPLSRNSVGLLCIHRANHYRGSLPRCRLDQR